MRHSTKSLVAKGKIKIREKQITRIDITPEDGKNYVSCLFLQNSKQTVPVRELPGWKFFPNFLQDKGVSVAQKTGKVTILS